MHLKWQEEQQQRKKDFKKNCFDELDKDKDGSAEKQRQLLEATFGDGLKRWGFSAGYIYTKWSKVRGR
jgi:hypothetical protein